MNTIFSNGMVLQREQWIDIFSVLKHGALKKIILKDVMIPYKNESGKTMCFFEDSLKGGPYTLTLQISLENQLIEEIYKDVYIGDVFVLSGQSNMEMDLESFPYIPKERYESFNDPYIRQYKVPVEYCFAQDEDLVIKSEWIPAVSYNNAKFSAVGWFFACKYVREYHVPVGLVLAAASGAPIEAFLSMKYQLDPSIAEEICEFYLNDENRIRSEISEQKEFINWNHFVYQKDLGINAHWNKKMPASHMLQTVSLPGILNGDKQHPGSIWLFKEVNGCPQNEDAMLVLGLLQDADETYWNGEKIGETAHQYKHRIYSIAKDQVQKENLLAVRLVAFKGQFRAVLEQEYALHFPSRSIGLEGDWEMAIGCKMDQEGKEVSNLSYLPTVLYNAMLYPLRGLCIKGVLWYQGESNTDSPRHYSKKMDYLLSELHELFQNEKLYFAYVKIADYINPFDPDHYLKWRELQMEQEQFFKQAKPTVEMIVLKERNDVYNLHPNDKEDVGEKLCNAVIEIASREDISYNRKGCE